MEESETQGILKRYSVRRLEAQLASKFQMATCKQGSNSATNEMCRRTQG
jgi:hypothetical protein